MFEKDLIPYEILNISTSYVQNKLWVNKTIQELGKKEVRMPVRIPHLWTRIHSALRELKDPTFGNKVERWYQVIGGLVDRFIHLKLKIHNQPGMLIAFSGLDGAGKTQHLLALKNAFEHSDIKVKNYWFRVGSLRMTNYFSRIYKGRNINDKKDNNSNINNSRSIHKNLIFIWRLMNIIEFTIYYNLFIRIQVILNKVVICDRYYLETLIDLESYTQEFNLSRILYKIFKVLIPPTDITFYIKVSPEKIYTRTRCRISEDINFNNKLFEKVIVNEPVIKINNDRNFDEVSTNLISKALTLFFNKYPTKYRNYKVVSYRYK